MLYMQIFWLLNSLSYPLHYITYNVSANIYSVPTITGKHLSMDHFFKKSISKSSLKQEKGALHSYMSLNSQINPVRKKKIVHVCLCVCVRAQKTSLEREYLA